jgi:hypothetical protein
MFTGRWSKEEDCFLTKLVGEHGTKWTKLSREWASHSTSVRTSKQIRDRWIKNLDPALNKEPWTEAEDMRIQELQRYLGNSWAMIAGHLPGRVGEVVKTRFYLLEKAAEVKAAKKQRREQQNQLEGESHTTDDSTGDSPGPFVEPVGGHRVPGCIPPRPIVHADELIPAGWSKHFTQATGRFFYYHMATKQSTWHPFLEPLGEAELLDPVDDPVLHEFVELGNETKPDRKSNETKPRKRNVPPHKRNVPPCKRDVPPPSIGLKRERVHEMPPAPPAADDDDPSESALEQLLGDMDEAGVQEMLTTYSELAYGESTGAAEDQALAEDQAIAQALAQAPSPPPPPSLLSPSPPRPAQGFPTTLTGGEQAASTWTDSFSADSFSADSFSALLHQDLIEEGPSDVLEAPLLQAHLPREKEPNSAFTNFLQCCPRLSDGEGEGDTDDEGVGDGEGRDETAGGTGEGNSTYYQAIEAEGEGGGEGGGAGEADRESGSDLGSGAGSYAGSNAGSYDSLAGSGYGCPNSGVGCSSRPFNIRVTWLRLIVTAVTCVCALVSLLVRRQGMLPPPAAPEASPTPAPTLPIYRKWVVYPEANLFHNIAVCEIMRNKTQCEREFAQPKQSTTDFHVSRLLHAVTTPDLRLSSLAPFAFCTWILPTSYIRWILTTVVFPLDLVYQYLGEFDTYNACWLACNNSRHVNPHAHDNKSFCPAWAWVR